MGKNRGIGKPYQIFMRHMLADQKGKKKWLPDISSNFTFYKKLFESDLGKEKYDECVESLRKANEILGDDYRVKLTGDLWADMESLEKAQYRYRQDYTDRHDEYRF